VGHLDGIDGHLALTYVKSSQSIWRTTAGRKEFASTPRITDMGLEALSDDVEDGYRELGESMSVSLDRETRNELAMLLAAMEPADPDELIRRAVHMLFQTAVETGTLDFHLRSGYDVTYDEYLSGMTYDEMTGANQFPQAQQDDDRRYQF